MTEMHNNDQRISPEEVKQIQLEMLKEIDSYCRNNSIRYCLSYGTLLGAIRHKGYIPWDDDVDLIMPYPDLIRFKQEFQSNHLRVLDIDTYDNYEFQFPRICNELTFSKYGKFHKWYGVNIDLYPVVGMVENLDKINEFLREGNELQKKADRFLSWYKRELRHTPFSYLPGYRNAVKKVYDHVRKYQFEGAKCFFHVGGMFKMYEVFNYDVFENTIEVGFENFRFLAPARYDEYLRQCYGDYMTPPPEDKRHPYHRGCYYWK